MKSIDNISIFGTSSDVGKSTITFTIAKILQDMGYSVAPFKAQNVSNNAMVADDGSEIAVAQYFQAEVLRLTPSYHLNPILLKSGRGSSASLILNGKSIQTKDVREYYRDLEELKPIVDKAYNHLDQRYDCIVSEGAGSPVELNLMDKDLSNIYIATKYKTKIILVADIERGGVFASIWGVYNLLPKELRDRVIGVIINKFRGDMTLFDKGIDIIEEEFGIPVLGILPYRAFNLGFEDSQSLLSYQQKSAHDAKKIGVVAYPTMSNYNDFEPLIADRNISLEFIQSNLSIDKFDLLILPGSKLVMSDLNWLKDIGLFDKIKESGIDILGICGGYQMMFRKILDPYRVESQEAKAEGFGFIDDDIIFHKEKVLKRGVYDIFGREVDGFEIHHGVSQRYPLYYQDGHISGTFVHGLFNDKEFVKYKRDRIDQFIGEMKSRLDIDSIINSIT